MVALMVGISLIIWVAQVQSQLLTETPRESLSPSKHRAQKKAEATPPVESSAPPDPAEFSAKPSPTPKRIRKKTTAEVSPSPTPTPVASPTPTPRKSKLRF